MLKIVIAVIFSFSASLGLKRVWAEKSLSISIGVDGSSSGGDGDGDGSEIVEVSCLEADSVCSVTVTGDLTMSFAAAIICAINADGTEDVVDASEGLRSSSMFNVQRRSIPGGYLHQSDSLRWQDEHVFQA